MAKLDKNISSKKLKYSPLSEITGFSSLVEYYEKHKDKSWMEWLEFYQTFEKPGKQGLVGLLKQKKEIFNPFDCFNKY